MELQPIGKKENLAELLEGEKKEEELESMKLVGRFLQLKAGLASLSANQLLSIAGIILMEAGMFMPYIISQNVFRLFIFSFLSHAGDSLLQASFGICITIQAIFFKSLNHGALDKIGIDISKALGAQDKQLTKKVFAQAIVSVLGLFCLITLPLVMFASSLMALLGYSSENAALSQIILRLMLPAMLLEISANTVRTFCMSQGLEKVFGKIGLINTAVSTVISYVLIVRQGWGIYGFTSGIFLMEGANLIAALVVLQKTDRSTRGWVGWAVLTDGLSKYILDTFKFCVATYFEILGSELTSYFVALTHDNAQISAVASAYSLASLLYKVGSSISAIARTRINRMMGMDETLAARNTFFIIYLLAALLGLLSAIFIFAFRSSVAALYTSNLPEVRVWLMDIILIYCFCMPSEFSMTMSTLGVRTIGKPNLLSLFTFTYFIAINSVTNFIAYCYGANSIEFFSISLILSLLINISCFLTVIRHKWVRDF